MLSLTLFSRYIRDFLGQLTNSYVGCNVGGLFVNVLAYADDIVFALQQLLTIPEQHIAKIDMECNIKKTVCMIFIYFADCIFTVHSSTHNSLQACVYAYDVTLLQHSISSAWRRQPLITNYSFTSEQVRKTVICAHN